MKKTVASRQSPVTGQKPTENERHFLPTGYWLLATFLFAVCLFLPALTEAASERSPRPEGPPRDSRPVKYVALEKDPFYIKYPQGENIQEAAEVLLKAQKRMERRYDYKPQDWVPVIFYANAREFKDVTGKSDLYLALVREDGLYFQPIRSIKRKASWQKVLAHEYTHWVQNELTQKRCPHWLAEGLAVLESGEGPDMERDFAQEKSRPRPSLKQMERDITNAQDQKKMNLAYFRAYQFCSHLEDRYGIKIIAQFLRELGQGTDPSSAAVEIFGQSLEDLVESWRGKGREKEQGNRE